VCFRTLDLYTSAVLESSLSPTVAPKPEFRSAMDAMSKARAWPRRTAALPTIVCRFYFQAARKPTFRHCYMRLRLSIAASLAC